MTFRMRAARRKNFTPIAPKSSFKKAGLSLADSGNVFFVVFAALAMVGGIGYGFNSVLRGPIANMTEVTRRTVAENTVMTSAKMSIVGATTHQTSGGDCDGDGMIEPLPFFDAGSSPHPTGGGWLPRDVGPPAWTLVPNSLDPWKSEYGYCAWDSGGVVADPGCGGATGRLAGSPNKNVQAIVVISAGKNRVFETTCAAYNPATPNAALYNKPSNSDDVVLPYTYTEANDLGNGLWTPDSVTPATDNETKKNIEVKGGGTFSGAVQMTGAGGLILPGDPGDDSITGACDAINDKQLRRNISDPANPTIEICDFTNGLGWASISGAGSTSSTGGVRVAYWKLDESSGITAFDASGSSNGALVNAPTWGAGIGKLNGALTLNGTNQRVEAAASGTTQPTSVTMTFWIKRNGAQPTNAGLVARPFNNFSAPEEASYMAAFNGASDTILKFVTAAAGSQNSLSAVTAIPDATWTHVAMVYDPLLSTNQKKIYINGALDAQSTLSSPLVYDADPTAKLYLGYAGGTAYFAGSMDDVRIYNYGLTDVQISSIYSAASAGLATRAPLKKGKIYSFGDDLSGLLGNGTSVGSTHEISAVQNGDDFIQISAGTNHSCGVRFGGTVWCWGSDSIGQLGNGSGTVADQQSPVEVTGLNGIVKVSASGQSTCALSQTGTAYCWGYNNNGMLGDGTAINRDSPVMVATPKLFIDITAGRWSSCGLEKTGAVWCWGTGTAGQLGNGASSNSFTPVAVSNITDFIQIHANPVQNIVCGVTRSGKAYCWGTEISGNFGNGATSGLQNVPSLVSSQDTFRKIETNNDSTCGLLGNGTLACWGGDMFGQVGNGSASSADVLTPYVIPGLQKFVDFSVGHGFSCGMQESGYVWCWGMDSFKQLGNGSLVTANQASPVQSLVPNVIKISSGGFQTLVLYNEQKNMIGPHHARDMDKLALSPGNICAIDKDDTAVCAGRDGVGQLGNGAPSTDQEILNIVTDAGPWKQIATGGDIAFLNHACGIKKNGNLYCWGTDTSGALGNGAGVTADQISPYLVGTTSDYWTRVAAGKQSTCAIKQSDSKIYCWGSDAHDHLGAAGSGNQASPVVVAGTNLWTDVAMGGDTVCAIDSAGDLYCWGDNTNGQIGNSSTIDVTSPLKITSNIPWASVSVGIESTCGVKRDGTLWCWGGTANTVLPYVKTIPTLIADPGPWATVSVFYRHACAIKVDSGLWCWGQGGNGRLGNGGTGNVILPSRVPAGNNWTAVKTAIATTCALKSDNSAWCWGLDNMGQLANGTPTADQLYPSRVSYYPRKGAFSWNTNLESFTPAMGINPVIGTTRYLSYDGAANTGMNFGASGSTKIAQTANPNSLSLMSNGMGGAAQTTLSVKGLTTNQSTLPGLVAHYKLDESSGTAAVDSASGNNAALVNTPTWVPAGGKKGGALTVLTASQQYANAPRSSKIEPNAVTVSVWFKRNGIQGSSACLVCKYEPTSPSYRLHFNVGSDTDTRFTIRTASGNYTATSGTTTIADGVWTHLVGTYDPASAAPQMRYYINGELVGTATATAALSYDTTSTGKLYIGSNDGTQAYPKGDIDDVQIYNRALPPQDVKYLYKSYNSLHAMTRIAGLDYASGAFAFARYDRGDTWLSDIYKRDLEVDNRGRVGINTSGAPMAQLDVNGAIRIGADATCTSAKEGMIAYNSSVLQYCDSTGAWKKFGPNMGLIEWDTRRGSLAVGSNTSTGTACGIKPNGSALCWGAAVEGKLGNNTTTPDVNKPATLHSDSASTGWSDWIKLSANREHNCGIRIDGSAWCWGQQQYGRLGNGTSTLATLTRPERVHTNSSSTGWYDWIDISAGNAHTCGVRSNGTAWCWGNNASGELGNNTNTPETRPVQVHSDSSGIGWSDWVQVSAGFSITCGIRSDGSAWCWGDAQQGGLGNNNSSSNALRPVRVHTDSSATGWNDWVSIGVDILRGCGLRANGTAWCWGSNSTFRTLGNNSTADFLRPVQVQTDTGPGGWSDWVQISIGSQFGCGIRSNGTAWCWGRQQNGRLGNNLTANVGVGRPVQVHSDSSSTGWSDWVDIQPVRGLGDFACGKRSNGTLWCWGINNVGQLGNGTTGGTQARPVQVQ